MIHRLQRSAADLHLLSTQPKVFHRFPRWGKKNKKNEVDHSGLDYENVFFLMEHLGSTFRRVSTLLHITEYWHYFVSCDDFFKKCIQLSPSIILDH